ncbi:MAG: hypothetical protein HQK63_14750 [Desulfamplus sp.]|nr:hypothetical protein [Desulfamplus sp.]
MIFNIKIQIDRIIYVCLTIILFWVIPALSYGEEDSEKTKQCYENFMKCELTRTDADDHFNGKPFKIIMINLFSVVREGDIVIITGAVNCWVVDKYEKLYVAVGVKKVLDNEQVSYYVVRKKDFSILATELMNYPYKERCQWRQYWLDLN